LNWSLVFAVLGNAFQQAHPSDWNQPVYCSNRKLDFSFMHDFIHNQTCIWRVIVPSLITLEKQCLLSMS